MSDAIASPQPKGARAIALAFQELPGWPEDDHLAALVAFKRSCGDEKSDGGVLRLAETPPAALLHACKAAHQVPGDKASARSFFETWFIPYRIEPEPALPMLTGYFEPELPASRVLSPTYTAALYARPSDLVTFAAKESPPGLPAGLAGARRVGNTLVPYPDRAEIEDGASGAATKPLFYLSDPVDAFMVHVQGSAKLRFEDGTRVRLGYAGRNGHAYTSVGRLVVEAGHLTREQATADRLYAWLKAHPIEAKHLMRQNRSFIFFREAETLNPELGPVGGASIQLTPGRSLAIDREIWSYGLPFWLDVDLRDIQDTSAPMRRLVIAQDTGTAIVGAARGDLFVGSGDAAGQLAGRIRHRPALTVLWPNLQAKP
jgi:membrane-bound lytic murein transglycosylase A